MFRYLTVLVFFNGIQSCNFEKSKLPDKNINCKLEGNFIKGDSLYTEKLICFFTENCCPTCILEVKKYSESIDNCPQVVFCTNKQNTVNRGFYTIINPKVVVLDERWISINEPVLFQTDRFGNPYNLLKIKYDEPYSIKEYLLKLSENESQNCKIE